MAAAGVQQADTAMPVAEQDQVLTQRTNFSGDVGGVSHKTDRVPVTPEQFPHRRAAPDLGQFGPAGGRPHGVGGAEVAIPLGDVHRCFLPPGFAAVFVEIENLSESE